MKKFAKDGDERVPTRYQTMTDKESYESFTESCSQEIKEVMVEYAGQRLNVYRNQPDSQDQAYRVSYTEEILSNKFPGISWWLHQRSDEVKPMIDQTTGLCKVSPV